MPLVRKNLQRTVYAEQARQQTRQAILVEGSPKAGLKGWRDVITPHRDVASGQYMQAEFAADLAQVAKGEGSDEYKDPVEFFRRTFITDGIKELLNGALQRLAGTGGDPVVELQTNFGGGKTHSMLALYHLFGEAKSSSLPGVEPLLKATGIDKAPKAQRAVLVGTALSPGEISTKPDGTKVRTLWGEMAWQLGGKEGYKVVAESDKKGTSPGSDLLTTLFNQYSPCIVLIDEWVAYSRMLVGKRDLPAGDFEAQATFAQALTEAAKKAKKTLVVASIPSSDIEIGGENGKFALDALRDIFERVGTPWHPASSDEGFEIVRRRLFELITDKENFKYRDAVIDSFSRMYGDAQGDFPSGCSEGAYRRKLEASYPIHPELFDRLYGEWSTLDKFQRTRGVLRLLAKVIHRLWEGNDAGLLIMPSSVPMDDPAVKSELTRYLADVWEPIISEDVDGPSSLPLDIDRATPTLGRYSACRRVARTLYLGTAPGSEGKNPGIDDRSIRLGCTQPGESAATFGDALRRVSERAKHVHQDGNRYWISTKANLNRVAEDRANELVRRPEELYAELVRRLRIDRAKGDFRGVHVCPDASDEVGDEPDARLVILSPKNAHKKGQKDSPAMKVARQYLDFRGSSPRFNRNCLVFLAPDDQRLGELMTATAAYLSWSSILRDEESLNLDAFQKKMATTKVEDTNHRVMLQIQEVWVHVLIPVQQDPKASIEWEELKVSGSDPLAKRTGSKLVGEYLYPEMGGPRLKMELDKYLWTDKDHVSVGQLAEWFPKYLYLPRLQSKDTLIGAIRDGMMTTNIDDTFAVAAGYDEAKCRYIGLRHAGSGSFAIDNNTLLVKHEAAQRQRKAEEAEKPIECGPTGAPSSPTGTSPTARPRSSTTLKPLPEKKPTVFIGSVKLDGSRLGRDAGKVAEEVLQHLSTLPGAQVEVHLEVHVRVPGGIPDDTVRTVTENANTLKFDTKGFERE